MNWDDSIHEAADALGRVRWQDCDGTELPTGEAAWEWYYAEGRLYAIRHKWSGAVFFQRAGSPDDALKRVRERYMHGRGGNA